MKFFPNDNIEKIQEAETVQYQVVGKVETPLFDVNVGWNFELNSNSEINSVKIHPSAKPCYGVGLLAGRVKLLAKLEELLKFNNSTAKKRSI
jgi:hypothetical protein